MIQNVYLIILTLLLIEASVLFFAKRTVFKKVCSFLPPVFWIYFLPMIATTLGILPSRSPVYDMITTHVLPGSLFLLLIGVDIKSILRLGPKALFMMLSGSLGIMLGAPVVLLMFGKSLPHDAWLGFGALSGSWVGGSANMIAVKEMIGTPDRIFSMMIAVDVAIAYSWMSLLIACSKFQGIYDKWNRSDQDILRRLTSQTKSYESASSSRISFGPTAAMSALAYSAGWLALFIGNQMPATNIISPFTWTIVIVSVFGVGVSFTSFRSFESKGASRVGYLMLYFVLTSLGAKADLNEFKELPIFLLAGLTWVLIHAVFLMAASRLSRSPLALVAAASQANIGGAVSAPIVAAVYHPSLFPVGLLLGIFGNVIGTYTALLCAQFCSWASRIVH